jgi:hypothetical protein
MMSMKFASRFVSGVIVFGAAAGLSPAMANPANKATQVGSAAGGAASRAAVPARPVRYCITEADETQIPRKYCKIGKAWHYVGVDLGER